MIASVMRVAWLSLRRDRVALALTYLLPLLFFSIFALVFGSQGRGQVRPQRVALVDEDQSEASRAFASAFGSEKAVRVVTSAPPRQSPAGAAPLPLDRRRAEALVRDGDVALAVVLSAGFGEARGDFTKRPRALLFSDPANPLAAPLVEGLLQKTAFTAQPERIAESGLALFEKHAGAMTPGQRQAVDAWLARPRGSGSSDATVLGAALVETELVPVVGDKGRDASLVAFYAAGIGVMFLLFSASAAGGSLIEEVESGTLERLLTSPLGMGRLLVGKWLFIAAMGIAQVTLMFAWGAIGFGLELVPHLAGFALMTIFTAAAAAAFGLVLATACRSRAQLGGISSIVILMMSALGGSMFPRFLMSEGMQRLGLLTFNGWALDGYIKVFWRSAPLLELWPQLLVLGTLTAVFLAVARRLARRWEIT